MLLVMLLIVMTIKLVVAMVARTKPTTIHMPSVPPALEREEAKMAKECKDLAKKNQKQACMILAKEIVRARKVKSTDKANRKIARRTRPYFPTHSPVPPIQPRW